MFTIEQYSKIEFKDLVLDFVLKIPKLWTPYLKDKNAQMRQNFVVMTCCSNLMMVIRWEVSKPWTWKLGQVPKSILPSKPWQQSIITTMFGSSKSSNEPLYSRPVSYSVILDKFDKDLWKQCSEPTVQVGIHRRPCKLSLWLNLQFDKFLDD